MMKHANVSFFVSHLGCPHQCSFCSQNQISGVNADALPTQQDVKETCAQALERMGTSAHSAEIAFFGGSFTMIEQDYMCALLDAASQYVGPNGFSGIRFSTRPDGIYPEMMALLENYPIRFIELGAQSMSDAVLDVNLRGHTAADVLSACRLIRASGYGLGLQMMTGLYGSDAQTDLQTAQAIAKLEPDAVRIYPTIVIRDTYLAQLYQNGQYQPQTLDEAVTLCAQLLTLFEQNSIPVIRLGLHAQRSLEQAMLAGPYHPAFRELCIQRLLYQKISESFFRRKQGSYRLYVAQNLLSAVTGHGAPLIKDLGAAGYQIKAVADKQLTNDQFYAEEV